MVRTPTHCRRHPTQEANIGGLRCREFEVDLRLGERLLGGEPIRVKLTKTISFCRRRGALPTSLTCWQSSGSVQAGSWGGGRDTYVQEVFMFYEG